MISILMVGVIAWAFVTDKKVSVENTFFERIQMGIGIVISSIFAITLVLTFFTGILSDNESIAVNSSIQENKRIEKQIIDILGQKSEYSDLIQNIKENDNKAIGLILSTYSEFDTNKHIQRLIKKHITNHEKILEWNSEESILERSLYKKAFNSGKWLLYFGGQK